MGSVNSTLTMPFIPYTVLTCDVTVHALKKKKKTKKKKKKTKTKQNKTKRGSKPTLMLCL